MQDPWGRLLAARLLCGLDGTKHHRRQRATTPDFHACRASPQDIDDSYVCQVAGRARRL